MVGGAILGGLFCWVAEKHVNENKLHHYSSVFDLEAMDAYFKGSKSNNKLTSPVRVHDELPGGPNKEPQGNGSRNVNTVHKSEFFKRVKDRYKHWKDGRYKAKSEVEKLAENKAEYLEWDHLHNDVEAYDKRGIHLGSIDPQSLKIYKDPVHGRPF